MVARTGVLLLVLASESALLHPQRPVPKRPPTLDLAFGQRDYMQPVYAAPPHNAEFLFFVGEKVRFTATFINSDVTDLVLRVEDLAPNEIIALKLRRREQPEPVGAVVEEFPVRAVMDGPLSLPTDSKRRHARWGKSLLVPHGKGFRLPLALDPSMRLPTGFYELRLAKFQVQCEHPCELVDYGGLQRFELRDTEGLPEQLDYLGRQAWYYVEFEKSKQALIWIDRMLKVYPTSSFAYQLRGRYAERRGQWQKAADAYDTGAKLLETGQDALRRQPRGIDDEGSALEYLKSQAEQARRKRDGR